MILVVRTFLFLIITVGNGIVVMMSVVYLDVCHQCIEEQVVGHT